ncbi:hypothetical protein B0A58_00285 [Flavobacterium branchiophilum NBRC 15030 = ATCC 35035]|nr:hypothetical protein B0A58_00285 [Flavobacterium branchiophilum NBRC 15030 = ATCC 35035]
MNVFYLNKVRLSDVCSIYIEKTTTKYFSKIEKKVINLKIIKNYRKNNQKFILFLASNSNKSQSIIL